MSTDLSLVRHHYMKSLQGITLQETEQVQSSFISLYTEIFHLMNYHSKTMTKKNTKNFPESENGNGKELISTSLWCFCLDYSPFDMEFLVRLGLHELLKKTMSNFTSKKPLSLEKLEQVIEESDDEDGSMLKSMTRSQIAVIALHRWVLLCSIGGRNGFYQGCQNRKKMMTFSMQNTASRFNLVDPIVRFRSSIVDGELVKSVEGIVNEPEEGADECVSMFLYVQSQCMQLLQKECQQSSLVCHENQNIINQSKILPQKLSANDNDMNEMREWRVEDEEKIIYDHLTFLLSIISITDTQLHFQPYFYHVLHRLYGALSPRITRTISHLFSVLLTSPVIPSNLLLQTWNESKNNQTSLDLITIDDKKEKEKEDQYQYQNPTEDPEKRKEREKNVKKRYLQNVLEKIGKNLKWTLEKEVELNMQNACDAATEMSRIAGRGIGLAKTEKKKATDAIQGEDPLAHSSPSKTTQDDDAPPAPSTSTLETDAILLPLEIENEFEIPVECLEQVIAMGFPESHAKAALKKYNLDVMQSVTWLLSSPSELMTEEEEKAITEHQSISLPSSPQSQHGLETKEIDGVADSTSEDISEKEQVALVYEKITKCHQSLLSLRQQKGTEHGYGSGIGHASKTDNEIMLIRKLARNISWCNVVNEVLIEILENHSSNTEQDVSDVSSCLLLAAFSVLGGHMETIRIGGRVRVLSPTGTNEGIVLNAGDPGVCEVLFDGAMEPNVVDPSLTFELDSETIASDAIQLNENTVGVYMSILFDTHSHNAANVPSSSAAKHLEKEEKDLLRSSSTTSTGSMDSSNDSTSIDTLTNRDVNASMLRTVASRSFAFMVRSQASASIAVKLGMLPCLLELATTPVDTLADTVGLKYLKKRQVQLRSIMYEIQTGSIVPLDAKPTVKQEIKILTEKEKQTVNRYNREFYI